MLLKNTHFVAFEIRKMNILIDNFQMIDVREYFRIVLFSFEMLQCKFENVIMISTVTIHFTHCFFTISATSIFLHTSVSLK